MDFGTLLHTAKQNEANDKKEIRYYSTKFSPPKKERKENKSLSVNIQKFLAKKEEEERQKAEEAKKKRDELLALRSQDKKATKRVNVMLKRTKSANQSVIQDAVDKDNTAVTLVGPSQPDEDDYGYVSQEASAFYNKMMEKYSKMPDEPKFLTPGKKVSRNLNSTKDRVMAALEREKEEALLPHKRKRKHGNDDNDKSATTEEIEVDQKESNSHSNKSKPKQMPPPMNFMEILKLAEQKQHEPIVIQPKPKDDDGPLMTKKQKREYEKERQRLEAKEARMKMDKSLTDKNQKPKSTDNDLKVPKPLESRIENRRVEKSSSNGSVYSGRVPKIGSQYSSEKSYSKIQSDCETKYKKSEKASHKLNSDTANYSKERQKMPQSSDSKDKQRNSSKEKQRLLELKNKQKLEELRELQELEELREKQRQLQELERQKLLKLQKIKEKEKLAQNNLSSSSSANKLPSKQINSNSKVSKLPESKDRIGLKSSVLLNSKLKDIPPKKFPPDDLRPKQSSLQKDSRLKLPSKDTKPKQFPPADVRQRPPPSKKRRILDDEDEYDSEMDDFIDDGPQDQEDYSKYIRDIFGYDKNKYRNIDDEDIQEASFHQQWKEEIISTKIGIMEDLEDMKKEEEEKRRKALLKKKKTK